MTTEELQNINTLAACYEYIVPGNRAKIKHILVVLSTA